MLLFSTGCFAAAALFGRAAAGAAAGLALGLSFGYAFAFGLLMFPPLLLACIVCAGLAGESRQRG